MKAHRYYRDRALVDRPYLRERWFDDLWSNVLDWEQQDDGRYRLWKHVSDDVGAERVLRIVLLDDRETVFNAFYDRDFGKKRG